MFVAFKITRIGWSVAVPEAECEAHYRLGNHARYEGVHGRWWLTELVDFFEKNHDAVLRRAGPTAAA